MPIENSLEGSVNATLDALVFETDEVQIVGEVVHPITHTLIARDAASAGADRARPLPPPGQRPMRALPARAAAPRRGHGRATAPPTPCAIVAESDQPWAALGNRVFGRAVRLRGPGRPASRTRPRTRRASSGWTATAARRPTADDRRLVKTSIVFWGLSDHPGALVDVLQEFAARGINLSKIESRPRKQGLGRYVFFADLDGRRRRPTGASKRSRRSGCGSRRCGCSAATRAPDRRLQARGYTFRSAMEAATARVTRRGPQGKAGRRTGSVSQPGIRRPCIRGAPARAQTAAGCWC